ncbi:MAG: AMP-binding protein [Candidatus Omnitrophota bacterium]
MVRNLWDRLRETAEGRPNVVAISYKVDDKWNDLSYKELEAGVRSLASFLQEEGIEKGDKAAIILENGPEWPIIFFSNALIGAISIPINPGSSAEEIENILKDSECKIVFTGKTSADIVETMRQKCPSIKEVIRADSETFENAAKRSSARLKSVEVASEDLACILYTSGTTAEPKGVMLTHGNLLANCDSLSRLGLVTEKDSVISILPLHHTYPLTVTMLLPLLYGGRVVYPGTMRGEAVLRAARESNSTIFIGVPQMYYLFYEKIEETLKKIPFPANLLFKFTLNSLYKIRKRTGSNLSRHVFSAIHKKFGRSMKFFVSGGAKLDEDVAGELFRLGFTILEGYGLTETSPVLTFNPPKKIKIGSAGVPIPDVELKIADKNEEGIGEVVARGPNIMKGYYKRDELTAGVIKDGWFHTGDVGYIDGEGYLFLTGRLKDVIVLSSGVNVYPEEVEEAYLKNAPVERMCVFEAPFKKGKEEVLSLWAVVVPDLAYFRKYGEVNLKAVIKERFDNVSRVLPSHMRLMGFTITLDELPHTLLGKIKRFAVKERYIPKIIEEGYVPEAEEVTEEDAELMKKEVSKAIINYLKKQTGAEKKIVPGDLLELDLGIDSLGRIELAAGLEKNLGVEIEDEMVGKAFTVRDLIENIRPLLPAGEAFGAREEEKVPKARAWREVLRVLPKEENLKKIDLEPRWYMWLGGFIFTCLVKAFLKVFCRLKTEGKENYPEQEGPFILYANHTSYFDGFLVASSFPRFPRLELFFVGFRPYFNVPIIRNLIRIGRIIPLDFSSHLVEALRSCYYVLNHNKKLFLYPEGLRTLNGSIGDFKKGFGILVKETNAKLVPVLIEGAYEAWPRTSKFPRPHPVTVRFGKALDAAELEKEGLEMGAEDGYDAICLSARKVLAEMKDRAGGDHG